MSKQIPTEHYKNISLENIVEEVDGILYTEEWKPIIGYEQLYLISSFGRLQTFGNRYNGFIKKIMALRLDKDGYVVVNLYNNVGMKTVKAHRLVGNHFISNPENKKEINHKKGFKYDNRFFELEWNTTSENMKHKHAVLGNPAPVGAFKKGHASGKSNPNARGVKCTTLNMDFDTVRDASIAMGISLYKITNILKGRCLHYNGLSFIYKN